MSAIDQQQAGYASSNARRAAGQDHPGRLTRHGSIPHKPPVTSIVMLTALDLEFDAVRRHLHGIRTTLHPAGTLFETGHLPGIPGTVALGTTGEGNISAAIVAERSIALFRPAALLCVGVAGSLKGDIALGDVVVATKVYAFHSGREHDDGFHARPQAWHASHELQQLARQTARTGNWNRLLHDSGGPQPKTGQPPAVHFKPIAAGEVVLTATGKSLNTLLRNNYEDAAAIDMESAGIAHAAHLNQSLPALSVRGISDKANALKHAGDAAGWQYLAAKRAAAFSIWLATLVLSRHLDNTANDGACRQPARPVTVDIKAKARTGAADSNTQHPGGKSVRPPA